MRLGLIVFGFMGIVITLRLPPVLMYRPFYRIKNIKPKTINHSGVYIKLFLINQFFSRNWAYNSMGWQTFIFRFCLASMSEICIMQAGHPVETIEHPVSTMFFCFRFPMESDIS